MPKKVVLALEPETAIGFVDNLKQLVDFADENKWRFEVITSIDSLQGIADIDVLVISRFFSQSSETLQYIYQKFFNIHVVLLAGDIDEDANKYITLAKNLGFNNIVTGILPGDGDYTIDRAIREVEELKPAVLRNEQEMWSINNSFLETASKPVPYEMTLKELQTVAAKPKVDEMFKEKPSLPAEIHNRSQSQQSWTKIFGNLGGKSKNDKVEEKQPRNMNIFEAASLIRDILADESNDEWAQSFKEAEAGNCEETEKVIAIFTDLLERELITVEELDNFQAAQQIFNEGWGLAELAPHYNNPQVEEITVTPSGIVTYKILGVPHFADLILSEKKTETLIKRLVPYDERGSNLSQNSPRMELTRRDHSRLTALCRPAVKGFSFILRKHGTIPMEIDEFMRLGTFDLKTWRVLSFLTRFRRNMIFCGPPNSGKTTLLELLLGEFPRHLAIRIIDRDSEIRASKLYPDRDIIEIEVHDELGFTFKKAFETTLRYSPDVYVVQEFRAAEEAVEVINAGSRSRNVLSTSHHTTESVVNNTVMMLMETGMSEAVALQQVCKAFHIIVEMFADPNPERGTRKVIGITEIIYDEETKRVRYLPLVSWVPSTDDYLGPGEWFIKNAPSPQSMMAMKKYGASDEEVKSVFQMKDLISSFN